MPDYTTMNWEQLGPARFADARFDPQRTGYADTGMRASGSRARATPGGFADGGILGLAMGGGTDPLTDIMVAGGRSDIPGGPPPPPMGGPPMGGPPMGGPPMGGPPMGDPASAETLMANADMLGGDMQRPPMEGGGGGGIEQDAGALAEAVFTRAQGDINAALAILDGATQILISSGQQEQPLMANSGMPLTHAGQSELDTRMKKIRDYEDWNPLDKKIQKVLSNEEVYKKYFSN